MNEIDLGFSIKNQSWDRESLSYKDDDQPDKFSEFDILSVKPSQDMGFRDTAIDSTQSIIIKLREGRIMNEPVYLVISYKDREPIMKIAGIDIMTESPSYTINAQDLIKIDLFSSVPIETSPPRIKRTITPNSQGMGERGMLLN